MRVFVRLVGGIWVATLLVTGIFAYVEIHAERTRLEQDLQRRTSLVLEAVRDGAAPVVGKGSRAAVERVLRRFVRVDRGVALFDEFGSLIDASTDVKAHLGPLSPLVSEAIRRNEPIRGVRSVAGRTTLVQIVSM